MALLKGRLFAGALFAGALLSGIQTVEVAQPQNVAAAGGGGGRASHSWQLRHEKPDNTLRLSLPARHLEEQDEEQVVAFVITELIRLEII